MKKQCLSYEKVSSGFKQNMDNMREKNLNNPRHEIDHINQALDNNDSISRLNIMQ